MLKLLKTIFFIVIANMVIAQSHHFIYIENTNKEWFTIKLNDKLFESIGKNFITIPKLANGNYNVIVNTQTAKETIFSIAINNADKGFRIKQNENNEVELFDINSFNTIAANANFEKGDIKTEVIATKVIESVKIIEHQPTAVVATTKKNAIIKKIFSRNNDEGVDEIYIDEKDTIAIFLPKIIAKELPKVIIEEGVIQAPNSSTSTANNTQVNTNRNCKQIADEIDVKNFTIAAQTEIKVKDRLKVAGVFFKEKCYTVNQIKRLCNLYISSNGKFIFFKQAQQSISDIQNFATLETELTESSVINEFKAFVKQL